MTDTPGTHKEGNHWVATIDGTPVGTYSTRKAATRAAYRAAAERYMAEHADDGYVPKWVKEEMAR